MKKLQEGHPNLLDYMIDGDLQLVINTPSGKGARTDEGRIRAAAVSHGIPCITTIQAADAAVRAMEALREEEMGVQAVQDRFPQYARAASAERSIGEAAVRPSWRAPGVSLGMLDASSRRYPRANARGSPSHSAPTDLA